MEVDARAPLDASWIPTISHGPASFDLFYSELSSRIESALDALAAIEHGDADVLPDAVLREAYERIWTGLERPASDETWKVEAIDRALEIAILRRADDASVYGTALFDALDLYLIHLEHRTCSDVLWQVIDSVMDMQTIDGALRVFTYIELRNAYNMDRNRALQLLKLCNELLRRCSRQTHTASCGRILQLLTSLFPVAERSGVNLTGTSNTANVTVYEQREVDAESGSQKLVVPTDDSRTMSSLTGLSKLIDRLGDAPVARPASRAAPSVFPRSEEYRRILTVYKQSDSTEPLDLITSDDGQLRFFCHEMIKNMGGLQSESRLESKHPRDAKRDTKTLVVTKVPPAPVDQPAEDAKMEDGEESTIDAEMAARDAAILKATEFYETFWSLQEYMADVSLLVDPRVPEAKRNFEHLKKSVPKVLEAFTAASGAEKALAGGAKGAANAATASADRKGKARAAQIAPVASADEIRDEYFFSKYLTGKGLLDLQINDLYFRRQILVQFLILFNYLLNTRVDAAGRAVATGGTPLLAEADERWTRETNAKVRLEIRQSGTDGLRFLETVELILAREANWVHWKLNKCPSEVFEKGSVPAEDFAKAREARRKVLEPFKPYAHRVGTRQLTKLWSKSIMLDDEALAGRQKQRPLVRPYREKLERIEAGDEGLRLSDLARDRLKGSIAWRALRSTAFSHSPALLKPLPANNPLLALETEIEQLDAGVQTNGKSIETPSGSAPDAAVVDVAADTSMVEPSQSEAVEGTTSTKRERSEEDGADDMPAKRLRSADDEMMGNV